VSVLTMALAAPLDPHAVVADVPLSLPPPAAAATPHVPAPNAVVLYVDLDLAGDGRWVVPGNAGRLAERHAVAFFHRGPPPHTDTLHVTTHLADDGDLAVRLTWREGR
jgi:hypothetical protein